MSDKNILAIVIVITTVALLLFSVLLGTSFVKLEYYQYGLKQSKSSNKVDTNKVYTGGSYCLGPDYTFKTFRATAHVVEMQNVGIFTSDNLEVQLTASFHYYLRKDDVPLLFRQYDTNYEDTIENNALSAFKNAVPVFSLKDLITKRKEVEEVLFTAVRTVLSGTCCNKDCETEGTCTTACTPYETCTEDEKGLFVDVRYFHLGQVKIPDDVEDEYLASVVLEEQTEEEEYARQEQQVAKETERQVNLLHNEANEITATAAADAELIKVQAAANATEIVEKARAEGLRLLYDELGITSEDDKNTFWYLRTLRSSPNAHLAIGYTQLLQYSVPGN